MVINNVKDIIMDQLEYAQAKQDYALGLSSFNPDAKSSFSVPTTAIPTQVVTPVIAPSSSAPTAITSTFADKTMNATDFNTWAETHPDAAAQFGASGGSFGENGLQTGTGTGWDYKDYATAGQIGLGAGQLGLGLASYLTQSKVADKQMRQMDQQYATNAGLIADRKANQAANANFASAFAKAK